MDRRRRFHHAAAPAAALLLALGGAPARGFDLAAALAAQASADAAVRAYVDASRQALEEGTRQGFEAFRAWLAARPAGAPPPALDAVLGAGPGDGSAVIALAGPFADALRAAVAGARPPSAPPGGGADTFGAGHQAAQAAALAALERAARDFWAAQPELLSSARWEVVFEALDSGLVPAGAGLGPAAAAFLRSLGVPEPAAAAAVAAEGLLAAQIGAVLGPGSEPREGLLAALRQLGRGPDRICPEERQLPEASWSAECRSWQPSPGGGTAIAGTPTPRPGEDPYNRIYAADLAAPGTPPTVAGTLAASAFVRVDLGSKAAEAAPPPGRRSKLHPRLEQLIAQGPATERVEVLVNLRDDFRVPRFPEPESGAGGELIAMADPPPSEAGTASDAAAGRGGAAAARAAQLVEQIRQHRAPTYQRLGAAWAGPYGVEVIETYWLVQAMLVEMPLGRVGALAERNEVLYLEPRHTLEEPPADANANNDIEDGRARISSDPYFGTVGSRREFVALLDTGVRFTHRLFNSPSRFLLKEDCTGADNACDGAPNPADDHWNHGTKSAGVLIANTALGAAFRGVTSYWLDSYKIYTNTGLDSAAAVRAFQRAVATLNRVIVAEIQSSGGETGTIATAADNAFDAGAVVIAANGNQGPTASTVRSPANAHKVLGVGCLEVETLAQVNGQSRGPAADNRIKPDLQAPTNTETASNTADDALVLFRNTSGATPYAGGAAALARSFLRGTGTIDPGQVYAFLILAGSQPAFNNTAGTGLLVMPTGGAARWGKVSVANGATVEVPFEVTAGRQQIEAAIWWPEAQAESHDDVDLVLVDPAGTVRQRSSSIPSVFEKVRFRAAPLATGTWKLQIRGFNVTSAPQDVYWAARAQN